MEESHSTSTTPFDIAILTLFGIIGLLGSIGNLCILVSLIVNKALHRIKYFLLMNLALSDLILCAISIPLRMLRVCVQKSIFKSEVISSDAYCRVTAGVSAAVVGTSSFGFLLLAVDKILAVKQPLSYRTRIYKKCMIVSIAISWLIPMVLGLCGTFVPALQANLHDHSHDVACLKGSTFGKEFALGSYCLVLLIPLILIFPMYIYIIIEVKKSGRIFDRSNISPNQPASANSRRSVRNDPYRRREIKLTKGIILILSAHLVCLTPIIVLDFMHIILGKPIPYFSGEICLLILHLNAVFDPPIYMRHCQEIKRTMIRLCCQLWGNMDS